MFSFKTTVDRLLMPWYRRSACVTLVTPTGSGLIFRDERLRAHHQIVPSVWAYLTRKGVVCSTCGFQSRPIRPLRVWNGMIYV